MKADRNEGAVMARICPELGPRLERGGFRRGHNSALTAGGSRLRPKKGRRTPEAADRSKNNSGTQEHSGNDQLFPALIDYQVFPRRLMDEETLILVLR